MVKSGGEEAVVEWREHFALFDPRLDVRWWDDPAVAARDVRYALVWDPEPGRLRGYSGLRAVFSTGAGVDNVVRDPDWPRHLPLVRMGGECVAQRMAEFACWACLSLLRGGQRMALAQAQARWDSFEAPRTAREVRVGVMGLGNLGTAAAAMLGALGFRVAGWSRGRKALPGMECFDGPAGLDAFLARADVLVCLLPATAETRGILNGELLARLPRGAAVVNLGRGDHVVPRDLLSALDSGQLSGAVLDVFAVEPLPADNPLWRHPAVTVTPHVASVVPRRERARYVAEAIGGFEAGGPLPNLYDPTRGY